MNLRRKRRRNLERWRESRRFSGQFDALIAFLDRFAEVFSRAWRSFLERLAIVADNTAALFRRAVIVAE